VIVAKGRIAGGQGLTRERPLPAEFRAFSGSLANPDTQSSLSGPLGRVNATRRGLGYLMYA
jgi:hypothetical protein